MRALLFNQKTNFTTLILFFCLCIQGTSAQTSVKTDSDSFLVDIKTKKGTKSFHLQGNQNDFKIEFKGTIVVSNDDRDVIGISRGGFLEIKKSSFGTKRRILIHNESGTLVKQYFVGWSERPFDPAGRAWLSEILPEIVNSTTIAAQNRVDRLYKKGGASRVLTEVDGMKSDFVRSAYIQLLLEKNLSSNDLIASIQSAANLVTSDYYISEILKGNQKIFLKDDRTMTAFVNATQSIDSDYYKSGIVKKVIEDASISDSQLKSFLEITKGISSDYYLFDVLNNIIKNRVLNDVNMIKVLYVAKDIGSDHYKTKILQIALKKENLSAKAYAQFLSLLGDINSDNYTSKILLDVFKNDVDRISFDTILKMMEENINSDHYLTTIYLEMAEKNIWSEAQLIQAMQSAGSAINSDNYLTKVLMSFAKQVNRSSEKVQEAYRRVAKNITSDTYYGRAMKALD